METCFFDRDGVCYISIVTDTSTAVDLVATDNHKAKYAKEWLAYNRRAHNEDGTFKADDPSTPENEAYQSPKKKTKRKAK